MITRLKMRVEQEIHPANPRKDFDNLTKIFVPEGSRYSYLGDKGSEEELYALVEKTEVFDNLSEEEQDACCAGENILFRVAGEAGVAVCLPLYMYEHSGQTVSTQPFNCPWDSGQVGWIYLLREVAEEELDTEESGWVKAANRAIRSEVETIDQWLRGDVWGYVIYSELYDALNGRWIPYEDCVESCWDFYGEKYAKEEGKEALKAARESQLNDLKDLLKKKENEYGDALYWAETLDSVKAAVEYACPEFRRVTELKGAIKMLERTYFEEEEDETV